MSLPFEDLGPAKPSIDALFNEWWPQFWEAWPHRVDKAAAMGKFRKALKTTDPADIIAGVETYKRNKEDWRAWMGPAKFLLNRRWEDVYAVPGNPRVDPDKAWQHKAAMAKSSWGRHNVTRQDKEELHRLGLLTDEQLAEALR